MKHSSMFDINLILEIFDTNDDDLILGTRCKKFRKIVKTKLLPNIIKTAAINMAVIFSIVFVQYVGFSVDTVCLIL